MTPAEGRALWDLSGRMRTLPAEVRQRLRVDRPTVHAEVLEAALRLLATEIEALILPTEEVRREPA